MKDYVSTVFYCSYDSSCVNDSTFQITAQNENEAEGDLSPTNALDVLDHHLQEPNEASPLREVNTHNASTYVPQFSFLQLIRPN